MDQAFPSVEVHLFHGRFQAPDDHFALEFPSETIPEWPQQEITVTIANVPKDEISAQGTTIPKFESVSFGFAKRNDLEQYLIKKGKESLGLLLIIVEGWEAWTREQFEGIAPGFPARIFAQVNSRRTLLPRFETGNKFSCIIDQVETRPINPNGRPSPCLLGDVEARRLPIAMWCRLKGTSGIESHAIKADSAVVIIAGEPRNGIPQRLQRFYKFDMDGRRWKRLESCAFWIYTDLLSVFTSWDNTWEVVRENLHNHTEKLYESNRSQPVLNQTQQLHRDTATTIDLRESMRLHIFSVRHFLESIKEANPNIASRSELISRLQNTLLKLEYYDLTSNALLEQQQNLLGMIFNTETVIQTQAVNRITVLGFIFLPLSFVASIFGITTFTASVRWYPVAAVPVLVFTVFAAWAMKVAIPLWQKRR